MQKTNLMIELEQQGWEFTCIPYSIGDLNEKLWTYKSPRMTSFNFFPQFTETVEEAMDLERELFVSFLENSVDKIYYFWKNKLLEDYRESLKNGNDPVKTAIMKIDEVVSIEVEPFLE
jgi:hypothetical protein